MEALPTTEAEALAQAGELLELLDLSENAAEEAAAAAESRLEKLVTFIAAVLASELTTVKALASKLGKSEPWVRTMEVVGLAMLLPTGNVAGKFVVRGKSSDAERGGKFAAYGAQHVRYDVNAQGNKSVKDGTRSVKVGWSTAQMRAIVGSVADRESFIAAINKPTARAAELTANRKKQLEEQRAAARSKASVLAEIIEQLEDFADLPGGENDYILALRVKHIVLTHTQPNTDD